MTFSNETYYVFILGFNHNSTYEGNNTLHMCFGKKDGKDIAFCDSTYGNMGMSDSFVIGTAGNGWMGCHMRNTTCVQFMDVLPVDLQAVIKSCSKGTAAASIAISSHTETTLDKIWLLSPYEVTGSTGYAFSVEENVQQQYDYYKNGNSVIRYRHNTTNVSVIWWLRSPVQHTTDEFCTMLNSGSQNGNLGSYSFGFVPCFGIG